MEDMANMLSVFTNSTSGISSSGVSLLSDNSVVITLHL